MSVQPLHRVLVCGPIAFVPCLGLFPYAFFFFFKTNSFQVLKSAKEEKNLSLREIEGIYFRDS